MVPDAHKDPTLNELKRYFATWEDSVMTFLYAVMFDTEKEETTDKVKIAPTSTEREMQMMAALTENKRQMERDTQAAKKAMETEKERYKEEMEREKAKLNAELNKMHEELTVVIELENSQGRLQLYQAGQRALQEDMEQGPC